MARRLRVEYQGAMYHVISRGNYRSPIFEDDRTKTAFVACLYEACQRAGWRLSAFVVMRNHFHLALETPRGNLTSGMQWLLSTFATRFNRHRAESGHVFQGRYRAILVESSADLGSVAHYIHLNPVRAGIVAVDQLAMYSHSSYSVLSSGRTRPSFLIVQTCLAAAGGLSDEAGGWKAYTRYLSWLAEADAEKKRLQFATISRGWAIGSAAFKQRIALEHRDELKRPASAAIETTQAKEALWEELLVQILGRLRCGERQIQNDKKSAAWKVAVAHQMKQLTTVKNTWLALKLRMGDPDGVSRYIGEMARGERPDAQTFLKLITDIRV